MKESNKKTEILKLLKESKGYLSGQKLCGIFGISRTAVWKIIHQLKEEGYEIQAVSNKGYCLAEAPDLLTQEEIHSYLTTKNLGRQVVYLKEVDSTNTRAKQLAEAGAAHGLLVVSENQTSGKGRRGNSWVSQEGSGIWMSLVLKPRIDPQRASMLTLVAALSVNMAVRDETGLDSFIKWPNDIVVNGKKICGILTEMSAELDYVNHIVVGIGINANISCFPEALKDRATSLYLESKQRVVRSRLTAKVLQYFEQYYDSFLLEETLNPFLSCYNSQLINLGKEVKIIEAEKEYLGVALGIDAFGHLLVRCQDGKEKKVLSGEVSVRGVYGYV